MTFGKHHIMRRGIAGLLLAACLIPSATAPATAVTESDITKEQAAEHAESILPSQWLAQIAGDVSEAEATWLDHESSEDFRASLTLTYDSAIPHDRIMVDFDEEDKPTLTASSFEGKSNHGTVTWIPVSVTWKGESYPLTQTDAGYTVALNAPDEDGSTVSVHYQATVSLSQTDGETLINAAYGAAQKANQAYADYETAREAYEKSEQAYAVYEAALEQYKSDMAIYRAYVQAMSVYEGQQAAYEAYLSDMEDYRAAQLAYDVYLTQKKQYEEANKVYMSYVNDPEAYTAKYLAYRQWLTDMKTADEQLIVLESCFLSDARGNQLFATLKGSTVATVVSRKEELVSSGCNETDIDNADKATKALQTLLTNYPLKGTKAKRYDYYKNHYTELKDNVRLLYTSLKTLYGEDMVPDVLEMQGKLERYWQFVGQLYVLTCLLDDAEVWLTSWTMGDTHLTAAVDSCYLLTDLNNATPLADVVYYMEAVKAPEQLKKPEEPAVVVKPVEPEAVAQPTRPEEVRRPNPPLPVARPDATKKPVEPTFSHAVETLRSAVKDGSLVERSLPDQAIFMSLSSSVDKVILPVEHLTAQFYAYDKTTLLSWATADSEGVVILPEAPTRPADRAYTYVFAGWVDESGRKVEGDTLTIIENMVLYATYTAIPVTYTVTWVVDGVTTETAVPYGATPTFEGSTEKAADAANLYEFIGWSPAPTTVTGDVTYTAQYRAIPRTYTVTWQWDGEEDILTESYTYGQLPAFENTPAHPFDGRYVYTFKGWTPEVIPVEGDAFYRAEFTVTDLFSGMSDESQVSLSETAAALEVLWKGTASGKQKVDISQVAHMSAAQAKPLILNVDGLAVTFSATATQALVDEACQWVTVERTAQGLRMELCDAEEKPLPDMTVQVTVSMTPIYGGSLRVYDAEGELCASSDGGANVSFRAQTGVSYIVQDGYHVSVVVSDGGFCHPSATFVPAGTTVTLSVTTTPGYVCSDLQVMDVNGAFVDVVSWSNGSYHFTMPEGGVIVTPTFTVLTYQVIFKVNGETVSKAEYLWGATPTEPADPTMEADENGTFIFKGWRNAVSKQMGVFPVYEDAEYEAFFEAVPYPVDVAVPDTAMKLWQILLIGVTGFVLSMAAVLVPFFLIRHKRKKS